MLKGSSSWMHCVLLLLAMFSHWCSAQRPTYAGSRPNGYPELADRFRDPNETSAEVTLANRLNVDGTTARVPVDARGDGELVDRLNGWDRDKRPFWLLNYNQIEAQRNRSGGQQGGAGFANRGSFAGGSRDSIPARPDVARSSFLGRLRK